MTPFCQIHTYSSTSMNHLMVYPSLDKKPEELDGPVTVVTTWHLPLLKKQIEMKHSSNKKTHQTL